MRTIRGLQITSIVVLSPVLLCMVSLISILFSSIIGWIFPTIQQQPFPAKSAPYQRNSSINHVFKKLQFVFRLRQSSVTLVILFLYLFYILFKKKRNKEQVVANQDILLEENITSTKKRKNSKRRKYKKNSKPNASENHHQHHVHSKPITTTILHNKPQHNEQPNDDTSQENWIHVKHHKEHVDNELKDDWNHQEQYQDTCNEQPQKYQDTCEQEQEQQTEYYNDTDYDEIWNINQINMEDDDWYDERQMHIDTNDKQKSEEHTPELTPIESEDEDHKQFKNWYSPFSTGLDLDILPKHISPQLDPLTLKYDTALPIISNFYTPKRPPSIEILENYPYIPSTSHHNTSFTHSFGPIGDKKK